ncbi:hypothetical protein T440DRAFT_488033 [Plenodomus tracheiphilus IPT5]|uniref:ATP-dependent DNA helicase n=1 Tax=Plenodomus tracheiphilus IPT5 TaxID=1408161 RepID=A0A6A7BAS4_9PLEO|nr:hypothetical protein T440DRAFT_488033 [Plenodomus tracheiphilus IPT5]
MAVTPHRIVQTSTEVKKQYKKNTTALPARQQKQLERGLELDQRAARLRESEQKRKAAKKKRGEKDAKEERARQQMGVGLATQMIGYSHTQAQLKNGMEAFLGVNKRRDEDKRKKESKLTKKLEAIAQEIEKEPWDDEEADDVALRITEANSSFGQQWSDDDLDDDSLLLAHDLVVSDPVEDAPVFAQNQRTLAPSVGLIPPTHALTKYDTSFVRNHGPINKAVEAELDKLPEELVELLSHDISMRLPEWDPASGLLHKLNPVGLPPHRLRVKVGCIVKLLRDFTSSSQLSKSQHLRILRADNDRLDCLDLDGQLKGTKTILTRVPFLANYRNQALYPFQRTQFPIRVATDYSPANIPRDTAQSGFKLPAIPGRLAAHSLLKRVASPVPKANLSPGFKVPGLQASKTAPSELDLARHACTGQVFSHSGTQIARELSVETPQPLATTPGLLPPMSTQDLDFSMEDLEDGVPPVSAVITSIETVAKVEKAIISKPDIAAKMEQPGRIEAKQDASASRPTPSAVDPRRRKSPGAPPKITGRTKGRRVIDPAIDLRNLRPSQKPPSVGDKPGLKRKAHATSAPPPKRNCAPAPRPVLPTKSVITLKAYDLNDFMMSTQDALCFFDNLEDD